MKGARELMYPALLLLYIFGIRMTNLDKIPFINYQDWAWFIIKLKHFFLNNTYSTVCTLRTPEADV